MASLLPGRIHCEWFEASAGPVEPGGASDNSRVPWCGLLDEWIISTPVGKQTTATDC